MVKKTHRDILKEVFGYNSFRPLQEEVITHVLAGKDALVVMPTGGGKSLCYQIPALLFPGLTLVVSPLISLMKDQVEQLTALGVPAVSLNSSLAPEEAAANLSRIRRRTVKLLYMAPETLLKEETLALLAGVPVSCLTIDEAHCISEWGHDFRPEYRQLNTVRQRLTGMVCLALTATATPRVQADIAGSLNLDATSVFISSFNRENLDIRVEPKTAPLDQTLKFIAPLKKQSGIIYCQSRKQVDDLSRILANKGYSARPYHAGLPDMERIKNQDLFTKDEVRIMVATIAFGMGINKPNVRFVVHYDLPKNVENYYQEIGRAGRDGLKAHCLLLFSYGDIHKIKYFINASDPQRKRVAENHLRAMVGYAESDQCRRKVLLNYFGEDYTEDNCGMCDNCGEGKKEREDITIEAQKFFSCVKRTGETFGAHHIIDVLRGSTNAKVRRFQHDRLSTYAIGKDYSKQQWQHLAHQFLVQGLLVQDMEFGGLSLKQAAWAVLRGEQKVLGWKIEEERPVKMAARDTGAIKEAYDPELFELLRDRRMQLARESDVPPYVIFPDTTLVEMATYFPQSKESLICISGVGTTKLRKYGRTFLHLLQEYCRRNGLTDQVPQTMVSRNTVKKHGSKKRHQVIGELYNSGKSLPELMEMFQIKQVTVLDHLFRFFQEGNRIQNGAVRQASTLSETEQATVTAAFREQGFEFLNPVYKALQEKVSYEELKIMRLYYLYQAGIVLETAAGGI